MNNLLRSNRKPLTSSRFLVGLFALAVASVSQQANAQSSADYRIGENATVLEAALNLDRSLITQEEFDEILFVETCQNPSSRLQARNRPYLSIMNTSTSADPITSVIINMEEAGFEFGDGDVLGDGLDGLLAMLSSKSDAGVELTSASYGADNSEAQLDFTGLTQGRAVIFRVDIDEPSGAFMFPDYREAIQGANEGNGRNGNLAILTTNFSIAGTTETMFPQVGELSHAGRPESYHDQTMTPPPTTTTRIPEPSSLLLVLLGLTGIGAVRRKRS